MKYKDAAGSRELHKVFFFMKKAQTIKKCINSSPTEVWRFFLRVIVNSSAKLIPNVNHFVFQIHGNKEAIRWI